MSPLREPEFEASGRAELLQELRARARVWLPDWRPREDRTDFAGALLEIAARLESEVTRRMSGIPRKTFLGFLDWLGVRGQPARAARLPVVFSMAPGSEAVLAEAPVQLQATGRGEPVTFETDQALRILPGGLTALVGADPVNDKYVLPPSGLLSLTPPTDEVVEWTVTSAVLAGATQLQLEPELGLDAKPTLLHQRTGRQYRVTDVVGGLVTIDPPLDTPEPSTDAVGTSQPSGLAENERLAAVSMFVPFRGAELNRQAHVLYLGSEDLLNLPAAANIQIEGLDPAAADATWSYWGKAAGQETPDWQKVKATQVGSRVVLEKGAGSIEKTKVEEKDSRWIRAEAAPDKARTALIASRVKLTVNCDAKQRLCPPTSKAEGSPVVVEAMANTTPLVLDASSFYPLGREPRLFDAFYLGSPEAFSKENALVEICFQTTSGASAAWNAAKIGASDRMLLFGVGADARLHRLRLAGGQTPPATRLTPVRPPFSETGALTLVASPALLNQKQSRLTAVSRPTDTLVAATAGSEAWLWSESVSAGGSRWYRLGPIADPAVKDNPGFNRDAPPEVVLVRRDQGLHAYALNQGRLYERNLPTDLEPGPWSIVDAGAGKDADRLHIAPVLDAERWGQGGTYAEGRPTLVAVNERREVAIFVPGSGWTTFAGVTLPDSKLAPLAIRRGDETLLFAPSGAEAVSMWRGTPAGPDWTRATWKETRIDGVAARGPFDWWAGANGNPAVVFALPSQEGEQLGIWFPLETAPLDPTTIYRSRAVGSGGGAPAVAQIGLAPPSSMPLGIIASTGAGLRYVLWNPDGLKRMELESAAIADAVLLPPATAGYTAQDFVVARRVSNAPLVRRIGRVLPLEDQNTLVVLDELLEDAVLQSALAIHRPKPGQGDLDGTITAPHELTLAEKDTSIAEGDLLVISRSGQRHRLVSVKQVNKAGTPWVVEVDGPVLVAAGAANVDVEYSHVTAGEPHPLRIHPLLDVTNVPVAALTQGDDIFVPRAQPSHQRVVRVVNVPGAAATAQFAVLESMWTAHPAAQGGVYAFMADKMVSEPTVVADTKSSTAMLSWEYWDGTAWWTIKNLVDGTGGLLQTGIVRFCVPAGLKPTDVAGRTSYWIRARLVSGDYGEARLTVTTTEIKPGVTEQTVDRSLATVQPPELVSVDVWYSVCCAKAPALVITSDGGVVRDQSQANRAGAALQFFESLTETIRRPTAGATPDGAVTDGGVPALYLGFDTAIQGDQISVLFLVDDPQGDSGVPLQVEVLRASGFEPVVADDRTRGLSESGVVTLSLAAPPVATALFGQTAPYWLRLRQNADARKRWEPRIRGAYLNAAFAYAAETQGPERLGSSDGSPDQRVFLARPPVLEDSLDLRVREPLDAEDVQGIGSEDPSAIRDQIDNLPGPWVRWSCVDDTADAAKDARVYAIDYDNGEITFGDGRHGKIPPIGRDSLIALHYRRGGGEQANKIAAWTPINLITPVQGVQAVVAPAGAAGGSNPQTAGEVVAFAPANQFMRGRALTLRDLEMLARQFSRDVAQARALPGLGGVSLVVVMRGREPRPSQEVRRSLVDWLGQRSLPMLAGGGLLTIRLPDIVSVRITVTLRVATLQNSATIAMAARQRLVALLDAGAGGLDGAGWPLGELPTETDVAAALDGIEGLEDIGRVAVERLGDDGSASPLLRLTPVQLVMLSPDDVVLQFTISTAAAEIPA
jgi:hypothetical protein